MRNFLLIFAMLIVTMIGVNSYADDATTPDNLIIEQPYAGATWGKQKNGAAFFTITNTTDKDIKIISASSDIAERVELHTHEMDGDMMMMRKVESFDIKANTVSKLTPMGNHIMFMGLKNQLNEGEAFDLTLKFDNDTEKTISVDVLKAGTKPQAADTHDHSDDHNHTHDHEHDHSESGKHGHGHGENFDHNDHDNHDGDHDHTDGKDHNHKHTHEHSHP